uniref:Uncharacterized protein n=2 Tax=Populus TaxID=3689 RepID=A0A4U5QTS2_POPAL|nr:hypothetical protein D5086_0000045260 [Populus alba]
MPEVANKELVVSLLSVVDVSLEIRKAMDAGCLWLLDNGGLRKRKKMREQVVRTARVEEKRTSHGRAVLNDSKVRFPFSCGPAIGHRLVWLPRSNGLTFRPSSSFGIDNNYPVKLLELVNYMINLKDLSRNVSDEKLRIQALRRCEEPVTAKIISRRLKRKGRE